MKVLEEKFQYSNVIRIGAGTYSNVYRALDKKNQIYVAIKEIDKLRFNQSKEVLKNEVEIMKKIQNENSIEFKEMLETNDYFYIVTEYCEYDLETYINQKRKKPFSVNEIREALIQINNTLKLMIKEQLNHRDLKPKNILISLGTLNKNIIKLSDYGSSKTISKTMSIAGTPLTMAPEILNDEKDLSKGDLWSIGIIIYYMYFNEYPYNGKNEHILFKDITSGKKLKNIDDKELNDLMNRLLQININERISWDEYFNHSFFKSDNLDNKNLENLPFFNFKCKIHSQNFNFYCQNCQLNICESCLEKHNTHTIIPFNNIGLNNDEINKSEKLLKEIENNINLLNKIKSEIQSIFHKMKLVKENITIYENDSKNDYKKYYIEVLERINFQLQNKLNFSFLNLMEENNILCEYNITNDELNKSIQLLNSYENVKRNHPEILWNYIKEVENEKEIKENCEIYLEKEKINFYYNYQFGKEGKKEIKMTFKIDLNNTNFIFYDCSSLTSLNLSNFNTSNVSNMSYMFYNCRSLISLNLSNFNTNNVKDMSYMFYNCSSLISLNVSNFNTNNVTDMSDMFSGCSSLTSLNLSNFNTSNVINIGGMFYKCSSIKSLDLSNFNTNKVTYMSYMFFDCSSLNSLNLSNFNTSNVNNISCMFSGCSSLTSLNLSNFNTSNVIYMTGMFFKCFSLISLNLSNFNTDNISDMKDMFSNCSKTCNLISNNQKILDEFKRSI